MWTELYVSDPALVAGNTVVLKPSDTTPVTTLVPAEIAVEFIPPGVLNVLCGDRGTGRRRGPPDSADGLRHRIRTPGCAIDSVSVRSVAREVGDEPYARWRKTVRSLSR
ncbi:hypothetical protein GCM10023191_028530 [Actinoallomurus oryzae]|uniref:Aldehyde dehydrogenase domain-containing protein n=1 Tax=Actinoallomurus oryzae TaxID=502180 RepID=A0ABP8PWB0_9ACTN